MNTNYGNFDFSAFNGGNGRQDPETIGLDTDPFRCATPLLPTMGHQFVGKPQAYMQEYFNMKEYCKGLEIQLARVTAERDTIKNMFNQLSAGLHTTGLPDQAIAPVKTPETYPHIRFWTQAQFNQWTATAEVHADPRWKLAYLELEEGGTVSDSVLKAIRKKVRGCWAELVTQQTAPKSWGKASMSAKELVYNMVYKSFSFLRLAENDWKLELLCSCDYPGWVRNNLDDKGKWLVKQEDDAAPGEESAFGTSRKRKANRAKSRIPEKRVKSDPGVLDTAENTDLPLPGPSDPMAVQFTAFGSTSSLDEQDALSLDTTTTFDAPKEGVLAPMPTFAMPAVSEDRVVDATTRSIPKGDVPTLIPASTMSAASNLNGTAVSTTSEDTVTDIAAGSNLPNAPEEAIPAFTESAIPTTSEDTIIDTPTGLELSGTAKEDVRAMVPIVVNPTAALEKVSLKLKVPPLPRLQRIAQCQSGNGEGSGEANDGSLNSKRKGTTNRKMRVAKNKTGYNLCAARWLAQININGTSEEFRLYWNQELDEARCEAYKREAKELVDTNAWNDVAQGVVH